jgi:hypothetical protein
MAGHDFTVLDDCLMAHSADAGKSWIPICLPAIVCQRVLHNIMPMRQPDHTVAAPIRRSHIDRQCCLEQIRAI